MPGSNLNVVVVTGNLTRDPELRSTNGGTSVCEMRVAVNGRRKDRQTGQWEDDPNYFDVVCFGALADNCAQYLAMGRPVAVEGRLDWREWEAKEGGGKRQAVQIIAGSVQFLGTKPDPDTSRESQELEPERSDFAGEPVAAGAGGMEDDIPF